MITLSTIVLSQGRGGRGEHDRHFVRWDAFLPLFFLKRNHLTCSTQSHFALAHNSDMIVLCKLHRPSSVFFDSTFLVLVFNAHFGMFIVCLIHGCTPLVYMFFFWGHGPLFSFGSILRFWRPPTSLSTNTTTSLALSLTDVSAL